MAPVARLCPSRHHAVLAPVSQGCPPPQGTFLRAPHPSAAEGRSPPRDLHVLSMPPAFALSQDQTLRFIIPTPIRTTRCHRSGPVRLSTLSRSLSRRPLPAAAPTAQHRRRRPARARARKPARNPGAARASSPDHTARIRKRRNTQPQAGPTPSMRNTTTTAETAQHSAANTAKKRARSRTHPIATPQHRSRGKTRFYLRNPMHFSMNITPRNRGHAAKRNFVARPSQALHRTPSFYDWVTTRQDRKSRRTRRRFTIPNRVVVEAM